MKISINISLLSLLLLATKPLIQLPFGFHWGMPLSTFTSMLTQPVSNKSTMVESVEGTRVDKTFGELRVSGQFLFGRLFSLAIQLNNQKTASENFEALVAMIQEKRGKPDAAILSPPLDSKHVMLQHPYRSKLPKDPWELKDWMVRAKIWIPKARWEGKDGSTISVFLTETSSKELTTVLLATRPDITQL